ncbi:Serine/arginine-rich SC35-like splicing factor SCL30, partial [Camellia lanceoleosa]
FLPLKIPWNLVVKRAKKRPEELRVPFERFGVVRDVYIPKNYYTGEPRGFAFVQFVDTYDATEAQYHMNRQIFSGREISVVVAAETRKRPKDMRRLSRSRSISRSPSPRYPSGSRSRHRSRKALYESDEARAHWRTSSPGRASRSPSGSRSRSVDLSPSMIDK